MHGLSARELVEAWSRGAGAPPAQRPLALLAAAMPDRPPGELAGLSLGRRDALLLALREHTFGRTLRASARCARCGARLEFELDSEQIRAEARHAGPPPESTLSEGGYQVRYRLPDSRDFADAAACASSAQALALLLRRCVIEARGATEPVPATELPGPVRRALSEAMQRQDPLAEIGVELGCSFCGHAWRLLLDTGGFVWAEVDAAAQRLLYDVQALAQAYGWSEDQILAMAPARRRYYLEAKGQA